MTDGNSPQPKTECFECGGPLSVWCPACNEKAISLATRTERERCKIIAWDVADRSPSVSGERTAAIRIAQAIETDNG